MQYAFGSGVLWGTPLTDADGVTIAAPSPVKFGALQEVSVDIQFNSKPLYGSLNFPLAIGRGLGKISLKAKSAQISGALFNSIFFGQTLSAGIQADYQDLVGQICTSTITVVPPSTGTFAADLGVLDINGVALTRVASSTPASRQYSVSAGSYTFNSGDASAQLRVYINYRYTATNTTARKQTVVNKQQGHQPSFSADLFVPYADKILTMRLYNCTANKLTISSKIEDWAIPDFDADCAADNSGNVMDWSTSE